MAASIALLTTTQRFLNLYSHINIQHIMTNTDRFFFSSVLFVNASWIEQRKKYIYNVFICTETLSYVHI